MTNITIIISPEGKAKVETIGYSGQSCREASQFLEQALGQKQGETFKSEYFSTSTTNNTEQLESFQ